MLAGERPRIGQRGGNQRTLTGGEVLGGKAEMRFGYCRDPVNALAHLDRVEIHLHDALLRPEQFDERGEVDLEALARPAAPWP